MHSLGVIISVHNRYAHTEKKTAGEHSNQEHIMLIADCLRSNLWTNVPKCNAVFRSFNHIIFCFYSQISYVKINNPSFVYYNLNIPVLPKLFSQCSLCIDSAQFFYLGNYTILYRYVHLVLIK